jgi:ferredoxin
MKKTVIGGLMLCVTLLAIAAPLSANDRFPRPEFQGDYVIPPNNLGEARSVILYYMDVVVLLAALCAGAYLVLKKRSRRGVLLLMLFSLAYFGFYKKGCVCSIGAIQNVTAGIFTDYAVPVTVFLIFALPLVFALFFGRIFCSGICPMGALQDLVAFKAKRVPARASAVLGIIPHIYLGVMILFAATGGGFPVCKLDPFVGIFRLSAHSGMIFFGFGLLAVGVFAARPYCRYICPYGLILGWASAVSKYRVKVCPGKCVNCRLCENACPVDAVRAPTSEATGEERAVSVKRLKTYCAMVPLWVVAGAVAGYLLADFAASFHPDVKLHRMLELEEADAARGVARARSLENEALRVNADIIAMLKERSDAVKKKFGTGMLLLGAYLGFVASAYLVRQSIRKKRDGYEADPMSCVSCGRCYGYCPKGKDAPLRGAG